MSANFVYYQKATDAVIDPLLLVAVIFAAPLAIVLFLGLGLRDYYRDRKCKASLHDWSEMPARGAGEIGRKIICKNCGASYIRHRGY